METLFSQILTWCQHYLSAMLTSILGMPQGNTPSQGCVFYQFKIPMSPCPNLCCHLSLELKQRGDYVPSPSPCYMFPDKRPLSHLYDDWHVSFAQWQQLCLKPPICYFPGVLPCSALCPLASVCCFYFETFCLPRLFLATYQHGIHWLSVELQNCPDLSVP